MFVTTVRWEYRLRPSYPTRRFVCLSDIDEFRELQSDTTATSAWYVKPQSDVDAGSREIFELVEFTVDGESRPIRRTTKAASQTYTVNLGKEALDASDEVAVAYTYRTVTPVAGHLLQLRVDQPTKNLSVELDYSDCDIAYVNVLDFIASSRHAWIGKATPKLPDKVVSVDFDGWAFPRSGIAFVWVLEDDLISRHADKAS
jgi:hypothetical protein